MKPILILLRIALVGLIWSVFFIDGIRVIMLKNWRFDIFDTYHWQHAWDLWLSGVVISTPKEWAFVLIIVSFIPLWLTGWAALSMLPWERYLIRLAELPMMLVNKFFFKPVKIIANTTAGPKIRKKKSYKEIRPKSIRAPLDEPVIQTLPTGHNNLPTGHSKPITAGLPPGNPRPETPPADRKFDHSLCKFDDDDDDFEFNIDAFDEKPAPAPEPEPEPRAKAPQNASRDNKGNKNKNKSNRDNNDRRGNNQERGANSQNRSGGNSLYDILKQKGYEVITGATIKDTLIDFIGIGGSELCICLLDKEPGDWLADEERFNDEEPLWFSESSHRISPVRKIDLARQLLSDKLADADLNLNVKPYVIIQFGNIINAEDMFEIWDEMNITVARIDRGSPKELKPFVKALDENSEKIDKEKLDKLRKLIRGIS